METTDDVVELMVTELEAACQMAGVKKGTLIGSIWASRVRERLGGERHYIAKAAREAQAARNAQICREFDGRNLAELAEKHGLEERQIRNILKACPVSATLK